MMRQVIKEFMVFAIIVVNIMWAAWIFAAIWRGADFYKVFDSIIIATLCLLCWMMIQRVEQIKGQMRDMLELVQLERRRYSRLLKAINDIKRLIDDGEWREDPPADTLSAVKERLDACKE